MAGRTRVKEHENLSDSNILRVIGLLEGEKPITKKAACEILNITYNTTRLNKIIEDFKQAAAREKEMRAKKRFTPPTPDEIQYVVQSYLGGEAVCEIAKSIYRSDSFVNNVLDRVNCPRRVRPASYWKPELLPEGCIKQQFSPGEKVFAARYSSLATIQREYQPGVYSVWLDSEEWQQFAYQPWWELGSLDHLRSMGIKL